MSESISPADAPAHLPGCVRHRPAGLRARKRSSLHFALRRRRPTPWWPGAGFTAAFCLASWSSNANPGGLQVVKGTASTSQSGPQLTVQVSDQAVLNWRDFNIAAGETTSFLQPSAASVVWNRINDANPSQIWGNLNANGIVVLINQSGFYFGPNSVIKVGGLVVSTAGAPANFDGGAWQFSAPPPLASIVNYGQIETARGGSAFLIAEKIENHGTLTTPDGNLGLYAGKEVLVSTRPDGRGLSAEVRLPSGSVDNTGRLTAEAGAIAVQARVINQNGLVQANSVRDHNGVIELVAGDSLQLGADSNLQARGDATVSNAGTITLRSGGQFTDTPTSLIDVSGGTGGGTGGSVEISAPRMSAIQSRIDGHAATGAHGGKLLIDPADILLTSTIPAEPPPDALVLNVDSAFLGFAQIHLQATRDITLAESTTWNLNTSTGVSASGSLLALEAGRNIKFADGSGLVGGDGWSVKMIAGADANVSGGVRAGTGSIFFSGGPKDASGAIPTGSGSLETGMGAIDLIAGQDVLVGTGFVRTSGGGSIHVSALAGDINAGTKNGNYDFSIGGYQPGRAGLGGIATAQGGDVILVAGHDVVSVPIRPPGTASPGASGAYGAQPGNVTVTAGHQVLGNFLLRNGQGLVTAGLQLDVLGQATVTDPTADIGSDLTPINLSLVSGRWQVWAAHDVFLNEVRNPNGTFNSQRLLVPVGQYPGNIDTGLLVAAPRSTAFLFDYAPDAGVSLKGGNAVTLVGENVPRVNGGNADMPPVYPPQLDISAGAGGVELRHSIVLFPSSQGRLAITTTAGGDLRGVPQNFVAPELTMSDSGLPGFRTFTQGHALSPLHLNNPKPVQLSISGSINNFNLTVPKSAVIDVTGNTYNFGFAAQNLAPNQSTVVRVGGDIVFRGISTVVTLTQPIDLSVLDPTLSANPDLSNRIAYNPQTHELTFYGLMTRDDLAFLLNPRVFVLDSFGRPILVDPLCVAAPNLDCPYVTAPAVLTHDTGALQTLFAKTQDISLGDQGFVLAGPGKLTVTARNLDLGVSRGIESSAPPPWLTAISAAAPELDIALTGNLDMTASKIASLGQGGSVHLTVGGTINVGSQESALSTQTKGIYTFGGGDVFVEANNDILVNGSRIATYDGGHVQVRSVNGNVDAGEGGLGYVNVESAGIDPKTGQFTQIRTAIPGSGIMATTLPDSQNAAGDIDVQAKGNITASKGGVLQLSFNDNPSTTSAIRLNAGGNIDAGQSGIIGGNVTLNAGGSISGIVVARNNINITAQQSVAVTALAQGGVTVSSGGTISGSIVGGSGVSVSGEAITAALVSQNVHTSGDASGASVGVPQTAAAGDTSKTASVNDNAGESKAKSTEEDDESAKKRRLKGPTLARSTGRVTVLLPGK